MGAGCPHPGIVLGPILGEGWEVEEFAAGLPFDEAGGAPVAEVLFVDGGAGEVGLHDGQDFWQGVEPFEDGSAGVAAQQAAVEFFLERTGGRS